MCERTSTTESLLAESDEQIEAEITVGRLVEVFQPPRMRAVVFYVLYINYYYFFNPRYI